MNITFENKLFHGKIEDSQSESIIPTDNGLFKNPSVLSVAIALFTATLGMTLSRGVQFSVVPLFGSS